MGAEYGADAEDAGMGNAAEAPAATRQRRRRLVERWWMDREQRRWQKHVGRALPVKPSDWPTMTKRQRKGWYEREDGQMGNASAEAAWTAGGAVEDGPGAAAEAAAETAEGVRPPKPADWKTAEELVRAGETGQWATRAKRRRGRRRAERRKMDRELR